MFSLMFRMRNGSGSMVRVTTSGFKDSGLSVAQRGLVLERASYRASVRRRGLGGSPAECFFAPKVPLGIKERKGRKCATHFVVFVDDLLKSDKKKQSPERRLGRPGPPVLILLRSFSLPDHYATGTHDGIAYDLAEVHTIQHSTATSDDVRIRLVTITGRENPRLRRHRPLERLAMYPGPRVAWFLHHRRPSQQELRRRVANVS